MHAPGVFDHGVWQVAHGALRLDLVGAGVERFIQIVLAGDHLGVESLCGLPTIYRATAITRCVLQRQTVVHEAGQQALISAALARQWCRAADMVALRSGSAGERVRQLLLMLSAGGAETDDGYAPMELPRLKDLAAIVDVAPETVSRVISTWRQQAMLLGSGSGSSRVDRRRLTQVDIPPGITRSSRRDGAAS
jgi:CRP-like cAMP-binding protein